jgi:serine/threonine protein kinase
MTEETLVKLLSGVPVSDRASLLDRECAGDPELRASVEARLAACEGPETHSPHEPDPDPDPASPPGSAVATIVAGPGNAAALCPPGDAAAPRDGRSAEGVGSILGGKYKLLAEIGAGGMGVVYMAEQLEPVRRTVAIKVIKAGMDTKSVLARFEIERQALALMDHPNIAKVFDAGTTGNVAGGAWRVAGKEEDEAFAPSTHHAPAGTPLGNVAGGEPRLAGKKENEASAPSTRHPPPTTPSGRPYFVMELVRGKPITTFCDHRRLTPRQRLELFVLVCKAIQHAHQKGVIHRDIKPSNVLVALRDDRPVPKVIDFGLAKATGLSLTERTLVTGVGVVIGTPQYMSPEQATPNDLDIDTRSDVYSLGVLLYELMTGTTPVDRKGLGPAGVVELLWMVREVDPPTPSSRLSTLETLPMVAANRGMDAARLAGALRGELDWIVMKALEKDRSRRYETATALARDIQHYLADEVVEARPPSAGYLMRKFVRQHKGQVIAASLFLLALVAGTIGTTWGYLRAERARQAEAERAEGERRAKQEAQQERDKAIRAERAAREYEHQRRMYAEAIADFVREDFLSLADVEDQPRSGGGWDGAGLNKDTKVRQVLDRAASRLSRRRDLDPRTEAELNWIVGVNYRVMGEAGLALPYLERCFTLRQQALGKEDRSTVTAQNSLAGAYLAAGKPDMALPLFEDAWRQRKAKLGPGHPDTLRALDKLAVGYHAAGRIDAALPLLEEAWRQRKAKLGPDHAETLKALDNLAVGYSSANRLDRSVPLFEEALKLREQKLGRDHQDTLQTVANLGASYRDAGRLSEALPLLVEAYQASRTIPALRWVGAQLLDCYAKAGRSADAVALVQELLDDARKSLRGDSPRLAGTLAQYGSILLQVKAFAGAEPVLRECLAIREKAEPDAWTTFDTQSLLGRALLGQGRHAEAEPLLRRGYEGMKSREKAIPPQEAARVPAALDRLIELYAATNRPDEAKKWQSERANYPRDATPRAAGPQSGKK